MHPYHELYSQQETLLLRYAVYQFPLRFSSILDDQYLSNKVNALKNRVVTKLIFKLKLMKLGLK